MTAPAVIKLNRAMAALDADIEDCAAESPVYKLLTSAEVRALPPLEWVVHGVFPNRGVGAAYGASTDGKTFLMLDMAAAVGEGRPWFGHRTEKTPVVYVCLEGQGGFRNRVIAWEEHNARPLPDNVRVVMEPFNLTAPDDVEALSDAIQANFDTGSVVILDTMNAASLGRNENAPDDMGLIIAGTKRVQARVGGLVIVVHHPGKDAERGMRGHYSMFAALDGVIETKRQGDARSWTNKKVKDGKDGIEHHYTLHTVEIGTDKYGDPETSCVVEVGEGQAATRSRPLTPRQIEGMDSLCRALAARGQVKGERVGVHLDAWRAEFYRISTADGADAKRAAFTRVRSDLVSLSHVHVENDWYSVEVGNGAYLAACLISKQDEPNERTDANETERVRQPQASEEANERERDPLGAFARSHRSEGKKDGAAVHAKRPKAINTTSRKSGKRATPSKT